MGRTKGVQVKMRLKGNLEEVKDNRGGMREEREVSRMKDRS